MNSGSAPDSWEKLEKLFYAALEMHAQERVEFLDQACEGDTGMREQVESLLAAAGKTDGFLDRPVLEAVQEVNFSGAAIGLHVGAYKILRVIGEGGMGIVYLAARADDLYQRQVAIKVVRAGFDLNAAMVLRFGSERQILANLDHPNIARLFDGGVTADGMPYLVMEYVDGVPIDRFCQSRQLNLTQRLQLFCEVCSAVDYAHKNLIVHRDIKPVNILVTANGVPKLLDFGIAKLLDGELAGQGQTRTVDRLMTPEYASPEQVRGEQVTTATDVYALGVLLYELLTGERLFRLKTASPLEVVQIICEREPVAPSEAPVAEDSHATPYGRRSLRGDLDNIVLTAVRKEPSRRYVSVAALAADIQAYLKGYPVQARTDGWIYRSGKFIRRHKAGVAATAAMVLALIAFSIGMGLLARRATREKLTAQREREFLASVFQAATPDESHGKEITARQLLDQAAQRIHRELSREPQLQAPLLDDIGYAYQRLGHYPEAQAMLQHSYDLRKDWGGNQTPEFASTEDQLGTVLRLQGKYRSAEPLFRDSLEVRTRKLGTNSLEVAQSLADLGECLYLEDRFEDAEPILRQALELNRKLDPNSGFGTRNYLALVLESKGNYQEAGQLLREALELSRRTEGTSSSDYANTLHNLAGVQIDSGNLTGAEATEREDLALRIRLLGPDHPDTAYSLNNLGWILLEKGDWQGAQPYLADDLRILRTQLGSTHPRFATAMGNWGHMLEEKGDDRAAEEDYRQALTILQQARGNENLGSAKILAYLGSLKLDEGDAREAERLGRQALEMRRKLAGADNPAVASSLIDVAEALDFEGNPAGAEPILRQALELRSRNFPAGHSALIDSDVRLGEVLVDERKYQQAEPILRQAAVAAHQSPFPLLPWQVAEADIALGTCLALEGNPSEGRRLIRQSETSMRSHPNAALRRRSLERAGGVLVPVVPASTAIQ
jgi:eukaryotic-like serine/threonine-protein kinase